jgi:hypothetical protein
VTHALTVELDTARLKYPQDVDVVSEYLIEVTNPGSSELNIPLVFDEGAIVGSVTGTSMVLLDDSHYGAPTGLPVQISKNWHITSNNRQIYDGQWLRGSTMVTLAGNETKRFRLKVICGHWANVPAASHAQLCLIGWGGNWKWEESALGSWGENFCFDPTQQLGGTFITDVRPAFTTPKSGSGTHNWTENGGGGNMLIYYDSNNTLRFHKRIKTAYRWTGPNLTEVHYSGVTDDDKIRFTYVNQLGRTYDYQRRFINFKYEFLQNVTSPNRLVYFQMAADRYTLAKYDYYDLGDDNGLISTNTPNPGGNAYNGSFNFDDRWLSIDDLTGLGATAKSRRGIIARDMTLNGSSLTPYMHTWGNTWGSTTMLFDLSADSVSKSYSAGDVVEGGVEYIMPPISSGDYWGGDSEFQARLSSYQNEWDAVYDEVANNDDLSVTAYTGTLLESFPVKVKAKSTGSVFADFEISSGGIGAVPIILIGVPAGNWGS